MKWGDIYMGQQRPMVIMLRPSVLRLLWRRMHAQKIGIGSMIAGLKGVSDRYVRNKLIQTPLVMVPFV